MSLSGFKRRIVESDDDDDVQSVQSFQSIQSTDTTRSYKCSKCGKQGSPCTKCECARRQAEDAANIAALFNAGQINGNITVEATIDGEAFKFTAKLTQERLEVNSSDLQSHVLEAIRIRVRSASKKAAMKRSAAQLKLDALLEEQRAAKRKREAEEAKREAEAYEQQKELEREVALAGNAADPTAPQSAGWLGWISGR